MLPVFYERRPESLFTGSICDHPFPCHVHDVAEIICLTAGEVTMTVGGTSYHLHPGDIAMAFPSVPHSYDAVSPDAAGLTLIFTADAIPQYARIFRSMHPVMPHLTGDKVPAELAEVIGRLTAIPQTEESPLRLAYLHLFLAHLFTNAPLETVEIGSLSSVTSQVLHYVSEHFTQPLSLESTARALGVSRIHLSHIFSQQLHINFRQYINSLRIDMACRLLRGPESSISQVAWQCGYSNLRTFHRAFLTQMGMPPSQYRRRFGVPDPEGDADSDDLPDAAEAEE